MNHDQAKKLIDEYADGRLSPDEAAEIKKHIDECRECSEMVYELRNLLSLIKQLPEKITPPHDLWKDIFHQIHDLKVVQIKKEEDERPVEEEPNEEEEKQKEESRKEFAKAKDKKEKEEKKKEKEDKRKEKDSQAARVYNLNELFKKYKIVITTASAILLLGILFFLIKSITGNIAWEISGTPGLYRINSQIEAGSELNDDGDVFETLNSAAIIIIPEAGRVQVGPDTRIEKTGGRNLNLIRGSIAVESTGSGEPLTADVFSSEVVQAEPGSNYKVQISEDNTADLMISSGKVLIQSGSLKSIVIPGYTCKITGNGPEIPINQNAPDHLKTALKKLSFDGDPASLNTALNESAVADALSLWHLFERIHGDNIDEVFVKLYSLVTPPKGVDQESILRLKQEALASWLEKIITSN